MKITDMVYNHNSRKYCIGFAVIMIVGATLIFSQYFGMVSLADSKALDPLYYYSQATFFEILHSLSNTDRFAYTLIHLADYVFITGLYPFIGVCLSRNISKYRSIILIPLLAGCFDILENLMMDIHLWFYPAEIPVLGSVAGVFTSLKFILIFISLIILIIYFIVKRINTRSANKR